MDIGTLISNMRADGTIARVANNPLVQFGLPSRPYLGATLLPEQNVPENAYVEESIRYRTVIANDGSRYSPVQKKGADLVGSFQVILGHSDIGREFSGRDYDTFIKLFGARPMDAAVSLLKWLDVSVVRAMAELNEKQRWDAILTAQIVRKGSNGYEETTTYPNPAGHRAAAGTVWSNNSVDPYAEIVTMVNLLRSKGYDVSRIITTRAVISILSANAVMRTRAGITTINTSNQLAAAPGFLDHNAINQILLRDGLPPIEEYNAQYRTTTGSVPFINGNYMVFVATTGLDTAIDLGDSERILTNTLGYHAVGRAVGQDAPGKVVNMFSYENKPPRIEGEGYQTTLPVITEPEAIAVISGIS